MEHILVKPLLNLRDSEPSSELDTPSELAYRLTSGRWVRARHLEYVSERIARMEQGPIRLMVFMPPRHGKSELCSHYTPVWFLKKFPWKRVILASYEISFAAMFGGKCRDTIERHPRLGLSLTRDTNSKTAWNIQNFGGGMVATGVGGAITGRGADLLIIDDPVKNAEEAQSPVYRQKVWDWYQSTAYTRLEPDASIIIIMTRWHDDDLAGRILAENSAGWEVVSLPAIAEQNDPLDRDEGEALWPQRYPTKKLVGPLPTGEKSLRESVGPYWWSALYQQRPTNASGGIFRQEWFKYYDILPEHKRVIQIWDTAFKSGQAADYSVCITACEFENGYAIMNIWRGRPEFPELERIAVNLYEKEHPSIVGIEDKASGQSLIQVLRRDTKLPIKPIKALDDKVTRAHSVTGLIEAGRVYLPSRASWLNEFLDEILAFPNGAHDDQVDTFIYSLLELSPIKNTGIAFGFV